MDADRERTCLCSTGGGQDQEPDAAGGVIYLTAAASPDLTGEAAVIAGRVIIGMTKIRQ
jgi:hypothetical protein